VRLTTDEWEDYTIEFVLGERRVRLRAEAKSAFDSWVSIFTAQIPRVRASPSFEGWMWRRRAENDWAQTYALLHDGVLYFFASIEAADIFKVIAPRDDDSVFIASRMADDMICLESCSVEQMSTWEGVTWVLDFKVRTGSKMIFNHGLETKIANHGDKITGFHFTIFGQELVLKIACSPTSSSAVWICLTHQIDKMHDFAHVVDEANSDAWTFAVRNARHWFETIPDDHPTRRLFGGVGGEEEGPMIAQHTNPIAERKREEERLREEAEGAAKMGDPALAALAAAAAERSAAVKAAATGGKSTKGGAVAQRFSRVPQSAINEMRGIVDTSKSGSSGIDGWNVAKPSVVVVPSIAAAAADDASSAQAPRPGMPRTMSRQPSRAPMRQSSRVQLMPADDASLRARSVERSPSAERGGDARLPLARVPSLTPAPVSAAPARTNSINGRQPSINRAASTASAAAAPAPAPAPAPAARTPSMAVRSPPPPPSSSSAARVASRTAPGPIAGANPNAGAGATAGGRSSSPAPVMRATTTAAAGTAGNAASAASPASAPPRASSPAIARQATGGSGAVVSIARNPAGGPPPARRKVTSPQ
jgi:hypothetical protein